MTASGDVARGEINLLPGAACLPGAIFAAKGDAEADQVNRHWARSHPFEQWRAALFRSE